MGSVSVAGRLPPEVIQRIVRQNFGRFRLGSYPGKPPPPAATSSADEPRPEPD